MKGITLDDAAYARLKAWKRGQKESFSHVVKRIVPEPWTLGDFLNFIEANDTVHLPANEVMDASANSRTTIKSDPWNLIADTSFLVGLWRGQAWAQSFARANSSRALGLPWIVQGEFWRGALRAGHDPEKARNFLSIGVSLNDAEPIVPSYAWICATLQDSPEYRAISQNDPWIAAVAMTFALPLVTKNLRHFGHIKGLKVEPLQAHHS